MFLFHKPYLGFLIAGYVVAALSYASTATRSHRAHLLAHAERPYRPAQWRALRWSSAVAAFAAWVVTSIGLGTILGIAACGIVWIIRSFS